MTEDGGEDGDGIDGMKFTSTYLLHQNFQW